MRGDMDWVWLTGVRLILQDGINDDAKNVA